MSYGREYIYNIPESVLFDSELTIVDLKIYAMVRSFMDSKRKAYPSNQWIADKLNINPRSVPRSMQRLEKRGHVTRLTIKGHRYLITGTPIPTQEPKKEKRDDTPVMGGCPTGHVTHDTPVIQLDQNNIGSKNNNRQVVDNLYTLGHKKITKKLIYELIEEYSEKQIMNALTLLQNAKGIKIPGAWLRKALENEYQGDISSSDKPQSAYAVPSIEETQKLLDNMFKKIKV